MGEYFFFPAELFGLVPTVLRSSSYHFQRVLPIVCATLSCELGMSGVSDMVYAAVAKTYVFLCVRKE